MDAWLAKKKCNMRDDKKTREEDTAAHMDKIYFKNFHHRRKCTSWRRRRNMYMRAGTTPSLSSSRDFAALRFSHVTYFMFFLDYWKINFFFTFERIQRLIFSNIAYWWTALKINFSRMFLYNNKNDYFIIYSIIINIFDIFWMIIDFFVEIILNRIFKPSVK